MPRNNDNNKIVRIRKSGNFYNVYDNDTYILYLLFGYKIKDHKIGFPKSCLNKVIKALEDKLISHMIIEDTITTSDYKNRNSYDKYYKLGFEKYNKDIHFSNIMDKITKLEPNKLDLLLQNIEDFLNE